ncbi:MAG: hypothetical protein IS860_11400 [Nitrosopumilus sp.]|nr:hypothetical protein [Nitrosopumilus sp.]
MKNLTTTTKTILFASLIAAMIMSFSTIDLAYAEEQTTKDKLEKLQEYKKQIESERSAEKVDDKDVVIERLNLIEELLTLRILVETGEINTKYVEKYEGFLLEQLEKKFDDTKSVALVSTTQLQPYLTATNFQTSTQTKFNCDDIANDTGYNWGTVTGQDFAESYVVSNQGYPTHIDHLDTWCDELDYDWGYSKFRNIALGGTCTTDFTSSVQSESGYCAKFGVGSPVLISAYAVYDGTVPFNTLEGWDFIWVQGP